MADLQSVPPVIKIPPNLNAEGFDMTKKYRSKIPHAGNVEDRAKKEFQEHIAFPNREYYRLKITPEDATFYDEGTETTLRLVFHGKTHCLKSRTHTHHVTQDEFEEMFEAVDTEFASPAEEAAAKAKAAAAKAPAKAKDEPKK